MAKRRPVSASTIGAFREPASNEGVCTGRFHMSVRSFSKPCIYRAPLDMQTLVWTRGPNFPLSRLESRLMCPECGSRRVSVLFDVPKVPVAARAKRATER